MQKWTVLLFTNLNEVQFSCIVQIAIHFHPTVPECKDSDFRQQGIRFLCLGTRQERSRVRRHISAAAECHRSGGFQAAQFLVLPLFLQSEGQGIVYFSFNLSFADIAVTLCKAQFGTATDHPGVARPSLCVQFGYTAVKIVFNIGPERICADAVTPYIRFANVNADRTIDGLAILDFSNPFVMLIDGIRADPANVSAIPFDLKLPAANIIGKILHRLIAFLLGYTLCFRVRFDRLPRSIGL